MGHHGPVVFVDHPHLFEHGKPVRHRRVGQAHVPVEDSDESSVSPRPPIERSHREGKEDQGKLVIGYPGGKEESALDNPSEKRLELWTRQSSRRPVDRVILIHP